MKKKTQKTKKKMKGQTKVLNVRERRYLIRKKMAQGLSYEKAYKEIQELLKFDKETRKKDKIDEDKNKKFKEEFMKLKEVKNGRKERQTKN